MLLDRRTMRRAPRCTVEAVVHRAGKFWSLKGELPGLSVLLRNRDDVFHTYSTYQRGLDLLLNTYNYLDLTPLGRQEENDRIQGWVRHHDRYEAEKLVG